MPRTLSGRFVAAPSAVIEIDDVFDASTTCGFATVASFVASLQANVNLLPVLECAFGPPCCTVYFPLFLDGDLATAFHFEFSNLA